MADQIRPELIIQRRHGDAPPDRADLQRRMEREGLRPYSWSDAPGTVYAPHRHAYTKHLVVARGSIRFLLDDTGEQIDLAVGDAMVLPAGTVHSAVSGPAGVTCLEAEG